jgi:phage terminase large subunit-like protein
MVPACQGLYELVTSVTIAHDGDPVLARHVFNATAKETGRGWRLTKPRGSRRHIDAAVATAIATSGVTAAKDAETGSVYDDPEHEILFLD